MLSAPLTLPTPPAPLAGPVFPAIVTLFKFRVPVDWFVRPPSPAAADPVALLPLIVELVSDTTPELRLARPPPWALAELLLTVVLTRFNVPSPLKLPAPL